ncbi:MAG TPA: DUF4185 domain-containing protein [Pyrinomonadaceae bacterium]|nr:DUF4185 domain-containing protein [Pyrinomonadaceae bacterium]
MANLKRGKTRKIVQLVGEEDREDTERPVPRTFSRYGLYGTDLGTPLDFGPGGPLWFLFGDAWTAEKLKDGKLDPKVYDDKSALKPPYNHFRPFNADPVGVAPSNATAQNLDDKFELSFFQAADGRYATLEMPGVSLLTEKVPTGAIKTPGGVYVFATGKPFRDGGDPSGDDPARSWVARWSNMETLKTDPPYEFSQANFGNYLFPVVGGVKGSGIPGHPTEGEVVWLWGTRYPNRQSSVRLAYVPLAQIGDRCAWRFFTHTSWSGAARWHHDEGRAAALFENSSVGEFSVAWNQNLGQWLMLYGCPDPRGIVCRAADNPWGPWSESLVVFEPWDDNGYKHFMHIPTQDALNDLGHDYPGGEYAPILIPRYTLGSRNRTTIRYTMSTWNPYTVVIMESELWPASLADEISRLAGRVSRNILDWLRRWIWRLPGSE